jgi:glutathione S-transferase
MAGTARVPSRPFSFGEEARGIMSIRLYGWPRSTTSRVHWALEELGVGYEYVTLDEKKGENRTPGYLAVSPTGKVPGLVDGGQAYFESLAIIIHLGETYGRERGLWPAASAAVARAEALCWTVWGTTELLAYMMQWLYHGLDTMVSYRPADRSKATADYNHGQYQRLLDALDAHLTGRDYILGGAFSLADIPAASALVLGLDLGGSIEGRKNIAAWLERCRARPAFARIGGAG